MTTAKLRVIVSVFYTKTNYRKGEAMRNTIYSIIKMNRGYVNAALGMHQGSVFPYSHKGRARFGI